jgi:hypothetical protein
MKFFDSLSGEQLVILAAVIAAIIGSDLTAEENNVLGDFITTIGDSLSLIASRQEAESKK